MANTGGRGPMVPIGRRAHVALLLLVFLVSCGRSETSRSPAPRPVILATTTSTQDSGLLDALVPAFERTSGYVVKTLAVGSGQAIELGSRGEADVLLVHSPVAEEQFMGQGRARRRLLVMHNDFVVVGPPGDPAGLRGLPDAVSAMKALAEGEVPFVSRGDESGTHQLERRLWKQAGIEPAGPWYQESGQGMGQTLQIAAEKGAYTISDRATQLASGQGDRLAVVLEGDPVLLNVYHVIEISRRAGQRVDEEAGRAFADWIVSPEGQTLIAGFGVERFGRPLFVADAGKDEAELRPTAA